MVREEMDHKSRTLDLGEGLPILRVPSAIDNVKLKVKGYEVT